MDALNVEPPQIDAEHWVDWQSSAVDPNIIRLNVMSLEGEAALDRLLYSDRLPRDNLGRLRSRILKKYRHCERGGWWFSGVDPRTGEATEWGCFKPDNPRLDEKGKPIKYEAPPGEDSGTFAPRLTWLQGYRIVTWTGGRDAQQVWLGRLWSVAQQEREAIEEALIPILVACALDFDLQNSLNMGVIFFGKRASTAQIGITAPKAIAEAQAVQLLGRLGEVRRLIAQLERRNAPGNTSICLSELATEGEGERLVTCLKEAFVIPEPEARQDLDEGIALVKNLASHGWF